MKLLIANGYVIDPAQNLNTGGRGVLIENGRIAGFAEANLIATTNRFENRATANHGRDASLRGSRSVIKARNPDTRPARCAQPGNVGGF